MASNPQLHVVRRRVLLVSVPPVASTIQIVPTL